MGGQSRSQKKCAVVPAAPGIPAPPTALSLSGGRAATGGAAKPAGSAISYEGAGSPPQAVDTKHPEDSHDDQPRPLVQRGRERRY